MSEKRSIDQDTAQHAPVAARIPTEFDLVTLWSFLLGVEAIGVHDHFFDLGGDSLIGTRLLARIHVIFGIRLSLRTLFDCPTIVLLAQAIEQQRIPSPHPFSVVFAVRRATYLSTTVALGVDACYRSTPPLRILIDWWARCLNSRCCSYECGCSTSAHYSCVDLSYL